MSNFVPISSLQIVRHVDMLEGVEVIESKAQKDELILEGNDIDYVSQSGNSSHDQSNFNPSNCFPKPHPSKVSAVSVTKISGSSWMVFTYRTKVQLSQRTLKKFFAYHQSDSLHVRVKLPIKCIRSTMCSGDKWNFCAYTTPVVNIIVTEKLD